MIWQKVWSFKDHGKSYDKIYHQEHPPGYRWLHDSFGTNWRMTEIQAVIGSLQLKRLSAWLQTRKMHADILTNKFSGHPALRVTLPPANMEHAYYKYYVFLKPDRLNAGWTRDQIMNEVNLSAAKTVCMTGSCSDIYFEQAFQMVDRELDKPRPNAKLLGETCLMFLVDPTLTQEDIHQHAEIFLDVLDRAAISQGCINA
jgi:dTDP-4-amino-4,6-dideoxygalactose transaminase